MVAMTLQVDSTTASGVVLILGAFVTLVGAVTASIVTVINAVASARGRQEVKATAAVAAEKAEKAAVHAETAVHQNEEILQQTDGQHAEMVELLKAALAAAMKPPQPVVIAPNAIERRVRASDIDPQAATGTIASRGMIKTRKDDSSTG